MLHRLRQDEFQCTTDDVLAGKNSQKTIEAEADEFASYLLMPLNDFRAQVTSSPDLEVLGACAERYGVSMTAAILKWLSYTEEKAVLVLSREGYMDWAWSSEPAFNAGAYFPTRQKIIPLPDKSLATNSGIRHERRGQLLPARYWFPYVDSGLSLLEMKLVSEQYDYTLTLLILPKIAECWAPRERDIN